MSSTDLVAIVRSYVERALKGVPGMKALILDADTTRAVSTALSQSDILEQEVYLVERIDAEDKKEALPHLKAVALLRPSRENVARLRRELRDPRFGSYHLYFTNRVEDIRLQDLAEGDTKELVACVHEVYGDFLPLEAHHISTPTPRPHLALAPMAWDYGASSDMINRLTDGLSSLMLCLRRRFQIRFQRGSERAQRLAQSLHHLSSMEQRELFDFGQRSYYSSSSTTEGQPLLLIIDRRDDPVTPLLSQWTYQAMIHEILGSRDNRVSLRHVAGLRPELAEAVLSSLQDKFFATHMYSNFGDVGMAIKSLVDSQIVSSNSAAAMTKKVDFESLDDMASFVENLPEMTHQQGITAKHVALMTELSHAVERRALMRVSGLEQDIACAATPAPVAHYDQVNECINAAVITASDKARLLALYGLRYEKEGKTQLAALMNGAATAGVDPGLLGAVATLLKHCSVENRVADIFSDRTLSSRIATLAKQHLKGVENMYTQHVPPLVSIVEKAARGKLNDVDYPRVDVSSNGIGIGGGSTSGGGMTASSLGGGGGGGDSGGNGSSSGTSAPPKLIVVFVVGGTTYEEAKAMAEVNGMGERGEGWAGGVRVVLAGTGPQNSTTFLEDWHEIALMERYSGGGGVGR